tara:strand:- start:1033 stop:1209 length:177 start_codon:yes stop_codon:yes gene_type:complete
MARKKKGNIFGKVIVYTKTYKGTSIGSKPITSTMNKRNKKGRSRKQIRRARGRGQGKP